MYSQQKQSLDPAEPPEDVAAFAAAARCLCHHY